MIQFDEYFFKRVETNHLVSEIEGKMLSNVETG